MADRFNREFKLGPIPFHARVHADAFGRGPGLTLSLEMEVLERATGRPTIVSVQEQIDPRYGIDFGRLCDIARRMLHRAMIHEVDEAILVKGERIFDPHAKESAAA